MIHTHIHIYIYIILITLDLKSLYINIPNHKRIEAVVRRALNSIYHKSNSAKVIIRFSFLILTLNNFAYNGIHYMQKFDLLLGLNVPQIVLPFLWENLKKHTSVHTYINFLCLTEICTETSKLSKNLEV